MKFRVKSLNGDQFDIEAEPDAAVLKTKMCIQDLKGWDATNQKLIYKGKVMANEKNLSDYKVSESDFLVCMVTKPKVSASSTPARTPASVPPRPVEAVEASSSNTNAADSSTVETSQTEQPMAIDDTTTPTETVLQPMETDAEPVRTAANSQREDALVRLLDMGFGRQESEEAAALAESMGFEQALAYLLSSDRGNLPQFDRSEAPSPMSNTLQPEVQMPVIEPTPISRTAEQRSTAFPSTSDSLQALRDHPRLDEFRRLVHANPAMLPEVLQILGQENPALLQLIDQNREQFVQMMNEPAIDRLPASDSMSANRTPQQTTEDVTEINSEALESLLQATSVPRPQLAAWLEFIRNMPPDGIAELSNMMANSGEELGEIPMASLTTEELDAVSRLTELGFPRQACLEAYLACDKNEMLAANFLLSNSRDENED